MIRLAIVVTVGLLYALTANAESLNYYAPVDMPPVEKTIEEKIRETFPEDPDLAVAIAKAESELNPDAYNPETHYDRSGKAICNGSIGIMQVACVHHRSNPDELRNVDFNLEIARKIYEERGWLPWGSYTDGRYKKYL